MQQQNRMVYGVYDRKVSWSTKIYYTSVNSLLQGTSSMMKAEKQLAQLKIKYRKSHGLPKRQEKKRHTLRTQGQKYIFNNS